MLSLVRLFCWAWSLLCRCQTYLGQWGVVDFGNGVITFLSIPGLREFARGIIAGEGAPPLNQAEPSFDSVVTTCL